MNRDTLYSSAVFDLDAGPVTVTLPNAGKRYMAMQVINQDEYTPMVVYKPGPVTLTRDKVGTRYVMALIRTLVDPDDPKDVDAGAQAAGCDQGQRRNRPASSRCRTGTRRATRR